MAFLCTFLGESHALLFEKNEIPPELAREYEYSLLQKVAKSTCIIKNTLIMDRIMKARNILTRNMYYSKSLSFERMEYLNRKIFLGEVTQPPWKI